MSATSSAPSIFGLPPNSVFTFLLSIREVPLVTINTTRSPTRSDSVLAILAGSTPKASAASATVAELIVDSITEMSGAFFAKKAQTDSRLILRTRSKDFRSGLLGGHKFRQFRQRVDTIIGFESQL